MMETLKLKTLTLENVRGIKSRTWDFEKDPIIYGENDVGKSTTIEAAYFMLTGAGLSSKKWDPTSNRFEGKVMIKLIVEINGVDYELCRNGVKYSINGINKIQANYLQDISKLIKIANNVTLAQAMNPNQLLGIDHWTDARKIVMELFTTNLGSEEEIITLIENELNADETIKNEAKRLEYSPSNATTGLNLIAKEKVRVETKLEYIKNKQNWLSDEELIRIKSEITKAQSLVNDLETQEAKYNEAKQKYNELQPTLDNARYELDSINRKNEICLEKLSNMLENDSGICIKCGQPIKQDEVEKEKTINELYDESQKYEVVIQNLNNILKMPNPKPAFFDVNKLWQARNELAKLVNKLSTDDSDNIDKEIQQLNDELAEINAKIVLLEDAKTYIIERSKSLGAVMIGHIQSQFQYTIELSSITKTGTESPSFIIKEDNVPLDLVNTANKVLIKIDFITKIQEVLGLNLPIFVDGLESILNLPVNRTIIGARVDRETNIC